MTISNIKLVSPKLSQWLTLLALTVCILAWIIVRFNNVFFYQIPPNQTIHPNYYTFHDMSQSWLDGKKLGVIDVSRLLINMHLPQTSDYFFHDAPEDGHCTYLALDPGFGVIVAAARLLITGVPDSYLRTECLQIICDGMMLFAIFFTFLRMGNIPATMAGLFYAVHPVFAYQAVFPFQYFWEGWLVLVGFLSLIWARRALLEKRRIVAVPLIILSALTIGFTLWVRSTALIVALTFILVFLTVPTLRRYCGIFFLVFALTIAPQVMRSSSVMGHFALSTRMSWHTAFQALGHYPNPYGLEDQDLYVFTKTQNDYDIRYNYCDYGKHDVAAKAEFMTIWRKDPAYVIHSIAARITNNIIFNYDYNHSRGDSILLTLVGLAALLFALRRRGEDLFIAGTMTLVYLGYNVAVGLVYFMAMPYAYVAQLALLCMIPSFTRMVIDSGGVLIDHPSQFLSRDYWHWPRSAPIAKTAFIGVVTISLIGAGLLCVPVVNRYFFPAGAYQDLWAGYKQPNLDDNQKLVNDWKNMSQEKKLDFLKRVYKTTPRTTNASYDVSRYIAENLFTIIYRDDDDNHQVKALFTSGPYKIDAVEALEAVSLSILGWRIEEISIFKMNDPSSWDGRTIHIKLMPTLERAGVDYQRIANEKFARFNYNVTWLGPNELIARHNGRACDALRTALAMYFHGLCPYDPATGPSPLTPENDPAMRAKSLTPAAKTAF